MNYTTRNLTRFAFVLAALFAFSTQAATQKGVKVYVDLFPAGDFIGTTSDVTGSAKMVSANEVKAENIRVNLKNFKTGIGLRDTHAKDKYLEVNKYPEAILVSATGKGGKGQGILKIRNKESKVTGNYELLDGNKFLKAKFKTKLSQYGIQDISYKGIGVEDEIEIEAIVPVTK